MSLCGECCLCRQNFLTVRTFFPLVCRCFVTTNMEILEGEKISKLADNFFGKIYDLIFTEAERSVPVFDTLKLLCDPEG